ncbi:hypothetical protein, partial [Plasmodium yoelii yoelii]
DLYTYIRMNMCITGLYTYMNL